MKSTSITSRQYAVPFILITVLFFLWGFARALLDVLNKHFQDSLDITITQSSLIQVSCYLAYFLMAVPAGMFILRHGYRRGVVMGLLLFAAGSFLFIPGARQESYAIFLGALFVLSCGLAFLETAANPYSTLLGPAQTATSRLNLSQSFNGLGSSLGPLVLGGYLFGGGEADISLPYAIMGVVVLLVAAVFGRIRLPEVQSEDTAAEDTPSNPIRTLLKNKLFRFGLLALLCSEIGVISINSYFVNFVTGMGWMTAYTASYILGFSLFIFMGGRFIGSWIMRSVPPARVLYWCAAGSVVCMIGVILSSLAGQHSTGTLQYLPVVFLMGSYLCESIFFPTIFSLAVQGLGSLTKTASSLLMMAPVGGCGFLLMAVIADYTTLVIPFVVPLLTFAVVCIYAKRQSQRVGADRTESLVG